MSDTDKTVWSSLRQEAVSYGIGRKIVNRGIAGAQSFLDKKKREEGLEPSPTKPTHESAKMPKYRWERIERFTWMWFVLGVVPWAIARFMLRGSGVRFTTAALVIIGLAVAYAVLDLFIQKKYQPGYLLVGSVLALGFMEWSIAHAYFGLSLPHVHLPVVLVAIAGTIGWSIMKPHFRPGVTK